jgi:glycosyltransferase involved in cell wall biosynthesis|tara:strand:+ start:7391 stop:8086 length:696 start_codon:yes stop_codon:yes gene_type:complete
MISLIVPFFNEENELADLVKDLDQFENIKKEIITEYIFIDDCSTDNSIEILKKQISNSKNLESKSIKVFSNDQNLGWCNSLIKGYHLATRKYCLYIPGDGEAKVTEFLKDFILDESKDLIVYQRKSMIGRPRVRVLISFIYRKILGIIFNLPNVDFNGLILIKSEIIKKIKLISSSNFISAEIILKSRKINCNIDYNNYFFLFPKNTYKSSSLNFSQFKKVIHDIFKYYLN